MVRKTAGRSEIWGFDIDANPRNAKRSIGIVPQEILFDPFFSPLETLELQAGLYGIPEGRAAARWSCCARCGSTTRRTLIRAPCRAA
jgi:ABC-type multidrug transport system ATPase subunit